ncbi:E3 ubiquitin-protein ligase TRIM33-like isoform X2 [Arapaima gigas]
MDKRCTVCHEPRAAQSLCTLCNKRLCYQCTSMHQDHSLHCPPGMPGPLLLSDAGKRRAYTGPSCWLTSSLQCHYHRQEPLNLFCETCDLLSCSNCHLSAHKDHRLVHVGKALQEQQWLFENLMVQVEDKRAVAESTAKQIEARLHSVKGMQRKAENQIKMTKMIMMNELTKRANQLIEQLERISSEVKRSLEEQLQAMIDLCSQLGHMQNFLTWATSQHGRNPLLFSKDLITYQMQRLLVSQLYSDLAPPVKIKFNWDASFWTRQISSLGQVTTEGGKGPHCEGTVCPSILRPQPISCPAPPPSLCPQSLNSECGYQACFQPQVCCAHCTNMSKIPKTHPDLLIGHSRVEQELRCHPLSPYAERSLLHIMPKLTPALQLDDKHLNVNPHTIECMQASQPPQPLHHIQLQGCLGPQVGQALVTHPQQFPQEASREVLQPGANTCYLGSSVSPSSQMKSISESTAQQMSRKPTPPATDPERPQLQPSAHLSRPGLVCPQAQLAAYVVKPLTQRAAEGSRTDPEMEKMRTTADQSTADLIDQQTQTTGCSRVDLNRQQLQQGARRNTENRMDQQSQTPEAHSGTDLVSKAGSDSEQKHPTEERRQKTVQTHTSQTQASQQPKTSSEAEKQTAEVTHRLSKSIECKGSTSPRMSAPSQRLPRVSLWGVKPGLHDALGETPEQLTGSQVALSAASTHSLATVARERDHREVQDQPCVRSPVSDRVLCPSPAVSHRSSLPPHCRSPLTTCKREPDKVHACEEAKPGGEDTLSISRQSQGTRYECIFLFLTQHNKKYDKTKTHVFSCSSGRAGQAKVPVVLLERLNIRLTPGQESVAQLRPPRQSGPYSDPATQKEATVVLYPVVGQNAVSSWSPPDTDPSLRSAASGPLSPRPAAISPFSPLAPAEKELTAMPPANEPESDPHSESEPRSEPESRSESEPLSEFELRSESEPDLYLESDVESEADVESEQQLESDQDLESETQLESDSELESEQQPESELFVESEPEFESEPESEQDQNSEPNCRPGADLEPDPGAPSACESRGSPLQHADRLTTEGDPQQAAAEMENEDFCAVCLNGGDLLCCDRCPKVFHLSCHIPPLLSFPLGDWVCTLCRDVETPEVEYDCENTRHSTQHAGKAVQYGLSAYDLRKCEKLALFISCNFLSAPFHEPVSPLARHYYQIIKKPMDLSVIRNKLNKCSPSHYCTPEEFVADVFLMFRNCAKFNYPDSEVAQAGRSLEAFFSSKLREVYPNQAFLAPDDDSDSEDYDEAYRGSGGFPWPERKEHSHRKRKRRHSANWRRYHT